MKPFIVVADGFSSELFDQLKNINQFEVYPKSKIDQAELQTLLPKINGLIIRSATTVDQALLEFAPNLKYVIRAGEGTDNIDKSLCQKKDVRVSNTPGANNNSAAEHAIALMFTLLRSTASANQSMHEKRWDKSLYMGNEVLNKTIGIVGFGRIGQIVAQRLAGFEPNVLFYDPFVDKSALSYAKKATLEEVFSKSDIVSIHVPLIKQTENLIDQNLLSKMKKTAILVNAARGKIVNEDHLYECLSQNKIKGAAFDVFANEPLPADSKLRNLENIILTPHLGASTEEAQLRVGQMCIDQLKEFFINNNLVNEVKI